MVQQSAVEGLIRLAKTGAALVLLSIAMPSASRAQIAVVVHPSNSLEELSLDKLRRLFLGQAKTFPAGGHARLAVLQSSAPAFDRAALGLQPDIVRSRWMAAIFRGEATSIPTELPTADDVKRFVREHPDAIAYIPASQVDAGLKAIAIDGHRPGDAGYVIR